MESNADTDLPVLIYVPTLLFGMTVVSASGGEVLPRHTFSEDAFVFVLPGREVIHVEFRILPTVVQSMWRWICAAKYVEERATIYSLRSMAERTHIALRITAGGIMTFNAAPGARGSAQIAHLERRVVALLRFMGRIYDEPASAYIRAAFCARLHCITDELKHHAQRVGPYHCTALTLRRSTSATGRSTLRRSSFKRCWEGQPSPSRRTRSARRCGRWLS